MIELKGKYNSCKIFTDVVDASTISHIMAFLNQECLAGSKIRIQADCHDSKGAVIGTTMTIHDTVIPSVVGVDIGCLDECTEILTEDGWIKISDYKGQKILVYDKYYDTAYFAIPNAYIIKEADLWYHIHNKYGLDQMVSPEHKMLIWKGSPKRGYKLVDYRADELVEKHESLARGIAGGIKTTFNLDAPGLNISDLDIRLHIMIAADGYIRNNTVTMHFKKQRKIDRCMQLLTEANIEYRISVYNDSMEIRFHNYGFSKSLHKFWRANKKQLKVICEESMLWDGTIEDNRKCFSSCNKENADLIQYAFACNGVRCGIHRLEVDTENRNDVYNTYTTLNEIVGLPDYRYTAHIDRIQPKNGEKKYCFNTDTGYFVIRRNNKISITGNCGMHTAKLKETRIEFPKLDSVIKKNIPSGGNIRTSAHKYASKLRLDELRCIGKTNCHVSIPVAEASIGTLGGGNHFIEVDEDKDGNKYLVVHTGSRRLGKDIAEYYQDIAYQELTNTGEKAKRLLKEKQEALIKEYKANGRQKELQDALSKIRIEKKNTDIPYELAYLKGSLFDDYIHDMEIAQEYAYWNRKAIIDTIASEMKWHIVDEFETIHNYIDTKNMILRKGSISAQLGEKVLIPINMRDGSIIAIGKGNEDYNYSAPHGAGRLMSRSAAKESIGMTEFKESMKGIYTTCVNKSTIDESPMAYKDINSIIENIQDTVDIVDIIKPVYNFKACEEEV